jgi:cadmium resistance protein CadD (predicted permease)
LIGIQFYQAAATVIPTLTVALVVSAGYLVKTSESEDEGSGLQSSQLVVYVLTVALVVIAETADLVALAQGGAGAGTALVIIGVIVFVVCLIVFEMLKKFLRAASKTWQRVIPALIVLTLFGVPFGYTAWKIG